MRAHHAEIPCTDFCEPHNSYRVKTIDGKY